jgi:hypothetical protein
MVTSQCDWKIIKVTPCTPWRINSLSISVYTWNPNNWYEALHTAFNWSYWFYNYCSETTCDVKMQHIDNTVYEEQHWRFYHLLYFLHIHNSWIHQTCRRQRGIWHIVVQKTTCISVHNHIIAISKINFSLWGWGCMYCQNSLF